MITGSLFIVLGIIHLIFSDGISIPEGSILIAVGILPIVDRTKRMMLVSSIGILLLGITNILTSIMMSVSQFPHWLVLGIAQIVWGILIIIRYRKSEENPKYLPEATHKREFAWFALRIGFYLSFFLFVMPILFVIIPALHNIFSSIFVVRMGFISYCIFALQIFVFILSIINLSKYKIKGFATYSLVYSILLILAYSSMFLP